MSDSQPPAVCQPPACFVSAQSAVVPSILDHRLDHGLFHGLSNSWMFSESVADARDSPKWCARSTQIRSSFVFWSSNIIQKVLSKGWHQQRPSHKPGLASIHVSKILVDRDEGKRHKCLQTDLPVIGVPLRNHGRSSRAECTADRLLKYLIYLPRCNATVYDLQLTRVDACAARTSAHLIPTPRTWK
ncbi:hypothetical protein BV22DRAFT_269661 [Leucogyrophana mollusca]|uniref:Uncharacterized protein n=1 Tax=Leucogyrophana mollusca TaxID=85980 RepID=A0ACB8BNJ6_9AGAM|nr:hypothetical protein BV22DRAFT_269661 [Leucogyrophana mollusca]